jgi:hypothetical protein
MEPMELTVILNILGMDLITILHMVRTLLIRILHIQHTVLSVLAITLEQMQARRETSAKAA